MELSSRSVISIYYLSFRRFFETAIDDYEERRQLRRISGLADYLPHVKKQTGNLLSGANFEVTNENRLV